MRQGCSPDPDAIFLLNQLPRLTSSWLKSSTRNLLAGAKFGDARGWVELLRARFTRLTWFLDLAGEGCVQTWEGCLCFFGCFYTQHERATLPPTAWIFGGPGTFLLFVWLLLLGRTATFRKLTGSTSWCLSCSCSWLLRSILWFSSLEFWGCWKPKSCKDTCFWSSGSQPFTSHNFPTQTVSRNKFRLDYQKHVVAA